MPQIKKFEKIVIELSPNLTFDLDSCLLNETQVDHLFLGKYLKTRYDNSDERFTTRFLNPLLLKSKELNRFDAKFLILEIVKEYYNTTAFDFVSASKIENTELRGLAFSEINIETIIERCEGERISTEGIRVPQRIYNEDNSYETTEIDLIYELWKVDLNKLDSELRTSYAVGCWCSSTNNKHFLWVEEDRVKDGPLEAIASLCWSWDNVLKEKPTLKRHGDLFLFETEREVVPEGDPRPLTKDEYFSMLVAQS